MISAKRAATAERVRSTLLDAAESLLAERQPGAITSRDLARLAGVSDGVLYNHFADKHDLLLTALVRRFGALMDAYDADRQTPGGEPVQDGVAALVRRLHALHLAALPMLANLVGDPELFRRFLVEIHRPPLGGDRLRRPVVDYLAAEQRAGRLGPFDAEAAADAIVGAVLLQGLVDTLGHRPPVDAQARLSAIADTLLTGLLPTHPARGRTDRPGSERSTP